MVLLKFLRATLLTHDGKTIVHGETFDAPEPYATDYINGGLAVKVEPENLPNVKVPEPEPAPIEQVEAEIVSSSEPEEQEEKPAKRRGKR